MVDKNSFSDDWSNMDWGDGNEDVPAPKKAQYVPIMPKVEIEEDIKSEINPAAKDVDDWAFEQDDVEEDIMLNAGLEDGLIEAKGENHSYINIPEKKVGAIVDNRLSEEEKANIASAKATAIAAAGEDFDALDINGDGAIDRNEINKLA